MTEEHDNRTNKDQSWWDDRGGGLTLKWKVSVRRHREACFPLPRQP